MWHLPDNNEIKYFRTMSKVSVSQLVLEVTSFSICPGIGGITKSESYMLHVVPEEATTECEQPEPKVFKRSLKLFFTRKST